MPTRSQRSRQQRDCRRRSGHWPCSLRQVAKALDRPLESIAARWGAVALQINLLHHANSGVEWKTLANHKSNAKAALFWFDSCQGDESAAVHTADQRRFPPRWTVEELEACFVVPNANGQRLGYFYFEEEPRRRSAAKLLTKDEARRIAANVAKLLLKS